jgi:hypothetical protein
MLSIIALNTFIAFRNALNTFITFIYIDYVGNTIYCDYPLSPCDLGMKILSGFGGLCKPSTRH